MLLSTACSCLRALLSRRSCEIPSYRTLFSLPDFSGLAPWNTDPETQTYHERKILPYGQAELFAVVADVGSYHHFLPFCTGSRFITLPPEYRAHRNISEAYVVDAELTVGFLSFQEKYVSQVTCNPYRSVEATASSSSPLFKTLKTVWQFQPVPTTAPGAALKAPRDSYAEGATLVNLNLEFAFANPIHASISLAFFGQVSKLMVNAFEKRCLAVYGPKSAQSLTGSSKI